MVKNKYDFKDLIDIMEHLRSEKGCPWDKEQTHQSLKQYLIEETYEVLEAVDEKDCKKLCEELGDVLLQVIFHARIADENGEFNINDVIDTVSKKMVSRHAHVFGELKAETSQDVINVWEKIKKDEKSIASQTDVLKNVPKNLPALLRSYKVQQKAAQVGFDWDSVKGAYEKLKEEVEELEDAYKSGKKDKIEEETGDVLFSIVNVSRFLNVHPELALTSTIEKFINRFEHVEKRAKALGKKLEDMSLDEMDTLWEETKK